jgi:DNA-binding NarL/FixJ family response regulator
VKIPRTPERHLAADINLSENDPVATPGTPVSHPVDEDLSPGTPVIHPVDEDLSPGTPVIRIGVLAGEPIRLAGVATVFEEPPQPGRPQLLPVVGTLKALVSDQKLMYMLVDFNSLEEGMAILETVKRSRPEMRQIVIGPDRDDELVLEAITAGARAYLYSSADPHTVRMAIDIVVSGSIWAPRRLLSRLIDELLEVRGGGRPGAGRSGLHLTARENEVLDRILLARSNREIAEELGIEERTVKAHVGRLMRKTGAENRIELSIRALSRRSRQGLVGQADEDNGTETE